MRYLLTEREYQTLRKKANEHVDQDKLQKLCTLAAEHIPVQVDWRLDGEPSPWGCILSEEHDPWHCDECPCIEVCPYEHKSWSK